jgi:hypothetical protein
VRIERKLSIEKSRALAILDAGSSVAIAHSRSGAFARQNVGDLLGRLQFQSRNRITPRLVLISHSPPCRLISPAWCCGDVERRGPIVDKVEVVVQLFGSACSDDALTGDVVPDIRG